MNLELLMAVVFVFLLIAIGKVALSFIVKKKVSILRPDEFVYEIDHIKTEDHKVLVVYEGGYWEIKEEVHSKEWSAEGGAQSFVDFDTNIDDDRYESFTGSELKRDEEGSHLVKILKEIDLHIGVKPETYLNLKF